MDNEEVNVTDIRFDSNLLATKVLLNPDVFNKPSPTIPPGFPKEKIPIEKCQQEIGQLVNCLMKSQFDNIKCQHLQKKFNSCKLWRDSLLFNRIKDWETELFTIMSEKEKDLYVESLKNKKKSLIDMYEALPVIPKTRGQRIRISSDIEQIEWRIKYCLNIDVKNLETNIKL
jgi:hypothetical protein